MIEIEKALTQVMQGFVKTPTDIQATGPKTGGREWIGLFEFHGDKLYEFDYPWYERQRYDGGAYYRFLCNGSPLQRYPVAAVGLFHNKRGGREQPIIAHLHGPCEEFSIKGGDDIRLETSFIMM